jgi:signal transduction histidine kinase
LAGGASTPGEGWFLAQNLEELPLALEVSRGNNRAMAMTRSEMGAEARPFRARHARPLMVCATALTALFWVAGGVFLALDGRAVYGNNWFLWGLFLLTGIAYVVAGHAIVRRQPGNALGWLMFFTAIALAAGPAASAYGIYAIRVSPGRIPAPGAVLALGAMTPWLTLMGILLILQLFPNGRPVSRRWRLLVWGTVLAWFGLAYGQLILPHLIASVWADDLEFARVLATDPFGWPPFARAWHAIATVGGILAPVTAVLSLASLFVRRARADAVTRTQLRWLGLVAAFAFAWTAVVLPLTSGDLYWIVITPLVALGIPIAVGIAIVRYRLLDIDVVIKKTVIFGVVAAVLVALYLAVIALATVGTFSRVVVGAVLLLVTFNPVRRAARSIADRVVYGKRASSYEVLTDFSERMAETYATDDVLPRMAQIIVGATGASAATVWLCIGSELQPAAVAGDPETPPAAARLNGDRLPELPDDLAAEVRHQGELLGALSVTMPANDPLDEGREKLVRDLASQAGLVLRNVRLIEELKASRQRLVAAQDEERRKLERNIHDGAQQQLVALAVKQRLVSGLIGRDDEKARELVAQLGEDTNDALENLRDLARGIYPPLLADRGLLAALEAQARKAPVPTTIEAEGVGRFAQDVEAAVYFSCLEALQNVAKYAGASRATVALANGAGELRFTIADDGRGFDPETTGYGTGLQGIADRLAVMGGDVAITSAPGDGTIVSGHLPAEARP